MKTPLETSARWALAFLLACSLLVFSCSDSSREEQKNTDAESAVDSAGPSQGPDEITSVVRRYGLGRFAELKKKYDGGFTLFRVGADGIRPPSDIGSLTDFQIDWKQSTAHWSAENEIAELFVSLFVSLGDLIYLNDSTVFYTEQVVCQILAGSVAEVTYTSSRTMQTPAAKIYLETVLVDSAVVILALGVTWR